MPPPALSILRRPCLPLIGEALECAVPKPPLPGEVVYAALSTSSVALRRQLPLIGEASGVSGKLHKGRCTAANLQVRHSIFFCFSKRKRWRVRNDHGGTSRRKRRLLSSVLISSFPNRKLNLRFGFYSKSATTIPQARSLCHYWYASSLYTRAPWRGEHSETRE